MTDHPGYEHRFDPDWVVPTSEMLREWLDTNHLTTRVAAVIASDGRGTASHIRARETLDAVLDDHPVNRRTAAVLAVVTGIPQSFWVAFERNYRSGLAAGKRGK